MTITITETRVAQTFQPVKSSKSDTVLPPPNLMRHHSNVLPEYIRGNRDKIWRLTDYYGVSPTYRILSKGLLLKHFDKVRRCLVDVLGLTDCQREVVFRLLRFWTNYRKVYPKASQICSEPGCSKATFWRTVSYLKAQGLIEVIPRDLTPFRRQISSLYILTHLLILIARYLAEHGTAFREKWLKPYLQLPGRVFWATLAPCQESRAGPSGLRGLSPGIF